MARSNVALQAFNRGLVSPLGLGRTDISRMRLSAEVQTNFVPRVLGSMMLRPGFEKVGESLSNNKAYHIPFIYSLNDTAILEMTDQTLRVRVDEEVITRASVSSAISNGTFTTDLTDWTDHDQTGANSSWVTGGYLGLLGTIYNAAIREQHIVVASDDIGVEHALHIVVARGELTLRVGSTSGGIEYLGEIILTEGTHSLTLTPTGDFYVRLMARTPYTTLIDSVSIEASGDMTLPLPWAEVDLPNVRWTQSGDVVFCACENYQQVRIERRSNDSWSVVKYLSNDGPFGIINTGSIRLTPSALSGDITITSSASFFSTSFIGSLLRITSVGQNVQSSISGDGQFSDPIRVTGVGTQRAFTRSVTGTFSATYTLQRSIGEVGAWADVENGTATFSNSYNDGLDNQIIYYRYGVKTGNYTSGTLNIALNYTNGGLTGTARVTGYTNDTTVTASVLTPFGSTVASDLWSESEWSPRKGWPSAVALHEGRLWWAGKGKIWGSVSDAYASYDDTVEGDSGPINRNIGEGPVDTINWMLPMQRLVCGASMAEWSMRSSSLDEPLTPTNANFRSSSTQGSNRVGGYKIDTRGVFVDNSSIKLFEIEFNTQSFDYSNSDLTAIIPDIGNPGIKRLAVQRKIDTRIHCVRNDGTVAMLIYDPVEDVKCWVEIETSGEVEDVFVLPADGREEDYVYYAVKRTINGSTVRFLERWAMESECAGGALSRVADCHVIYDGSSTTTISAPHLPNTEVVVWADGKDLGTFTLDDNGEATASAAFTKACIGLGYTAQFKSTKLAYAAQAGTALTERKRVAYLGVILANTHAQGIQYGPDFDRLDDLPEVEYGATVAANTVWEAYDRDAFEFNGDWDTDSRVCLQAEAPRCATMLACVIGMDTNERV